MGQGSCDSALVSASAPPSQLSTAIARSLQHYSCPSSDAPPDPAHNVLPSARTPQRPRTSTTCDLLLLCLCISQSAMGGQVEDLGPPDSHSSHLSLPSSPRQPSYTSSKVQPDKASSLPLPTIKKAQLQ